MRLTADDPEADKIGAILVTCPHCKYKKRIPTHLFVEMDTTEGWVDHMVPNIPTMTLEVGKVDPDKDNPTKTGNFKYEVARLEGKVEVLWQGDY